MEAKEIQINVLLEPKKQFLIPNWQRQYAWTSDDHEELWEDILRVNRGDEANHFLGSFVVKQWIFSGMPQDALQYWVIDGQQRLVTITIILIAIRDTLVEQCLTEEDRVALRETLTQQLLRTPAVREDHQARLVLQADDHPVLLRLIKGESSAADLSLIQKAYRLFVSHLVGSSEEELYQLLRTIQTKLDAVWIKLDEEDNAHRVFQTLNAGGKPLLQSDLVRNFFFLLLRDDAGVFYENYWLPMERSLAGMLDRFLAAWTVTRGYQGSDGSLFRYFQKELDPLAATPAAIEAYGLQLTEAVAEFNLMHKPLPEDLDANLSQVLKDLAQWGTKPAEGLVLFLLLARREGRISDNETAESLEMVLSFMARRFLSGYEPNLHTPIFAQIAMQLSRQSSLTGRSLVSYLRYQLSSGSERRTWPGDDELVERCPTTRLYSNSRRHWAFLVLERLNRAKFTYPQHAPRVLGRDFYSIEHVMPQTLTSTWQEDLSSKWGVEDVVNAHEASLHVLGNLTLTPINSELSQRPFGEKTIMIKDNQLPINVEIVEADRWTPSVIEARSKTLAQLATTCFTTPLSSAELQASEFAVQALAEELPLGDELDDEN